MIVYSLNHLFGSHSNFLKMNRVQQVDFILFTFLELLKVIIKEFYFIV